MIWTLLATQTIWYVWDCNSTNLWYITIYCFHHRSVYYFHKWSCHNLHRITIRKHPYITHLYSIVQYNIIYLISSTSTFGPLRLFCCCPATLGNPRLPAAANVEWARPRNYENSTKANSWKAIVMETSLTSWMMRVSWLIDWLIDWLSKTHEQPKHTHLKNRFFCLHVVS